MRDGRSIRSLVSRESNGRRVFACKPPDPRKGKSFREKRFAKLGLVAIDFARSTELPKG
jgi:hypothetical protein